MSQTAVTNPSSPVATGAAAPAPPESPASRSRLADIWIGRLFLTLAPSMVRMIGAGFQFLSTVIVARTLGDGPSAPFFFWTSVLMTSGPIATFGFEQLALKQVPRLEREGLLAVSRFVGNLRAIALVVSSVLGIIWIVYAVFAQQDGSGLQSWHFLPWLAQAAIALTLINGEALKGHSRPVLGNIFGHVLPVSLFSVALLVFASSLDANGILAVYAASFAAGALLAWFAPGKVFRTSFFRWPDPATLRSLLRDGFPVCCVSLFGALGFIVPLAICEVVLPAAEVSHLTAAFRIAILFIVISGTIHGVFAPALSRNAELEQPLRPVMRVYGKAIAIALISLGPPLLVGVAFPVQIMTVFGHDFIDGADALRMLLIIQLMSLMMGPVAHLLLMTGHTSFLARLGSLKLFVVVGLSALLVPRWGGVGMVIAMGIGFLCEGLIGVAYGVRKMHEKGHRAVQPS